MDAMKLPLPRLCHVYYHQFGGWACCNLRVTIACHHVIYHRTRKNYFVVRSVASEFGCISRLRILCCALLPHVLPEKLGRKAQKDKNCTQDLEGPLI